MILVTGGTGFVGVNLVRFLVKRGKRVRVLLRPTSSRKGFSGIQIEEALGDVTDYPSVLAAMKGITKVYHVAGVVEFSPLRRSYIRRVNVRGTENVCRAALDEGVSRCVHTSTLSAVGEGTREAPATEETPYTFARYRIPYNDTKREAEDVVLRYVRKGLDAVIVNPAFMIGPWDMKPSSGKIIIICARHGIPFYPTGGNSFLDIDDAVIGLVSAMEKGRTGERYILANENMSWRKFFTLVADVVGRRSPSVPVLYPVAMPLAYAGNVLGLVWPGVFSDFNTGMIRSGFLETYADPSKAVRELGLPRNPVRNAVEKAAAWLREYGYLP